MEKIDEPVDLNRAGDDGRVQVLGVSRQEARDMIDIDDLPEDFITALDEAQGGCTEEKPQYIVLRVKP